MKLAAAVFLSALIVIVGTQIYSFWGEGNRVEKSFLEISERLEKTKLDEKKLQAELEYFANPDNVEKELRSRFNYRGADEKMIIIVPRESQNQTSSGNREP